MLFNSFQYLVYLPLVVIVYFLLPHKFRWIFLLAASYYFYMVWKPEYILLIVVSTLVDYFAGILMEKQETKAGRKPFLIASLFVNLGLLFVLNILISLIRNLENSMRRLATTTIPLRP